MSNPLKGLFFPLSSLSLNGAVRAGENFVLDAEVKLSRGRYSGSFTREGKSVRLSLEKLDEHDFWERFLDYYFFRAPEKRYTAARKFLARVGLRNKKPIEMEYAEQKYKVRFSSKLEDGSQSTIQLFYSPSVDRMVARRV